ncbi:MAG: tetratricopeptide repeat protein, partial [Planctomycetota bacterium]
VGNFCFESDFRIVKTLFFQKDYSLALEWLKKNSENIDKKEFHYWRGRCLLNLEKYSDAKTEFETALKLNPDSADTHYRLSIIYKKQSDTRLWKQELDEAIRLHPTHAEALKDSGVIFEESKSNLIKNWSFEEIPSQENNWDICGLLDKVVTKISRNNSFSGEKSLNITFVGGCPNYFHTSQKVNLEPGKKYRLSFLVMTDGLTGKRGIGIDMVSVKGNKHFCVSTKEILTSYFWQRVETEFRIPDGISACIVRARRLGDEKSTERFGIIEGAAWIDNISLVKLD